MPLVKQADGSFELTIHIPRLSDDKIFYKYMVDGEWLVSPNQKVAKDDGGIDSNVLEPQDVFVADSGVASGSRIPEAGGLLAATGVTGTTTAAAAPFGDPNSTVMPSTELHQQYASVKRSQYKAKEKKKATEAAATGLIPNRTTTEPIGAGGVITATEAPARLISRLRSALPRPADVIVISLFVFSYLSFFILFYRMLYENPA